MCYFSLPYAKNIKIIKQLSSFLNNQVLYFDCVATLNFLISFCPQKSVHWGSALLFWKVSNLSSSKKPSLRRFFIFKVCAHLARVLRALAPWCLTQKKLRLSPHHHPSQSHFFERSKKKTPKCSINCNYAARWLVAKKALGIVNSPPVNQMNKVCTTVKPIIL